MKTHSLPKEGEDNAWFYRLNDFERQETKRQVNFKRRHRPDSGGGVWSKRHTYLYLHIMPENNFGEVFYEKIVDDVFKYYELKWFRSQHLTKSDNYSGLNNNILTKSLRKYL